MLKKQVTLATFDGKLLDGLVFCRKVYDLVDQIRSGPNGIAEMRLRSTRTAKKLIEELIPIARYVQARYRESRRIKVRWFSGSQSYEAILLSSGLGVEKGLYPKKLFVEVTMSVHPNDYLARQQLHEQGGTFGPKNIQRNMKTREITSEPYAYNNDEREVDLASQILQSLQRKTQKSYPPGTVLIIACITDSLILLDEWQSTIEQVKRAQDQLGFREVFLVHTERQFSATLYGT